MASTIDSHFKNLSSIQATGTAAAALLIPLIGSSSDYNVDPSGGLSLLLARPHVLLESLHHLVLLAAFRLSSATGALPPLALIPDYALRSQRQWFSANDCNRILAGEILACHEVMEKTKGLEHKIDYQIRKLVGLAEVSQNGPEVVPVEEDLLAFRPNPSAFTASSISKKSRNEAPSTVYRPPRVAAVPYSEPYKKRTERRAPALLSEFAASMEGAPAQEATTGLATRPVQANQHSNSMSAKRAAELKSMDEFEEENMMRLVTSKREAKRRKEDEASLALGYGVGGSGRGRGRRQNGLDGELEGVLGERVSRNLWDGIGKQLGKRSSVADRAQTRGENLFKKPRTQ